MSNDNFDVYAWKRKTLNENTAGKEIDEIEDAKDSKHDLYLNMIIQELEGFDGGAAEYLKNHRNIMLRNMESIDFDAMNEDAPNDNTIVYKVEGITADTYEGGPDVPFEMEVELDASLSDNEVKDAIRDAARKEQGRLYKIDYKKA